MSLTILIGEEASRGYENTFFRDFASRLEAVFEKEQKSGILIGFPLTPKDINLKPDCILITKQRILIVDFKNYAVAKIYLPSEHNFESSEWKLNTTGKVAGGSSINPFMQLKKQRERLGNLLGIKYEANEIAAMVCFQTDPIIDGEVPGKYQRWFSVTTRSQCMNKVFDEITVRSDQEIDIQEVRSLFVAQPFHDYSKISFTSYDAIDQANQRSIEERLRADAAQAQVKQLENELRQAKTQNLQTKNLQQELKLAKHNAEERERIAKQAKDNFDEKNHALQIEINRADQERAKVQQEVEKTKQVIMQQKTQHDKLRGRIAVVVILGLTIFLGIGAGLWLYHDYTEKQIMDERRAAEELEAGRLAGEICIPLNEVAKYSGATGVCVEYYVGYIGSSRNGYVFLNDKKNGSFLVFVQNQKILNAEDAKQKYLNKVVQVHGDIEPYNNQFEIKLYREDQIKVVEE